MSYKIPKITALDWKNAVHAASTSSLTATYANGTAGVGATLTNSGALAALVLDGVTISTIGQRVLIKDQGSTFQNGIYTLTTAGTGAVAWILTRATDYNTVSQIGPGNIVPVVNGTIQANESWIEASVTPVNIGTDAITFGQFTTAPISLTQFRLLVAGANSTISFLSSAGSSGQILQSGGASANPSYSTATYPSSSGGTGKILYDNGTNFVESTPTFPASASATAGKFIQSDGTNWVASTPTLPTSAGTSGKILQSNGTNYVESTPTYPSTSGSTGKILISDGTNNVYSTPTYPNTATGTGTILRADGTNWVATTATYPATTTVSQILYSSSANVVAGLATANSTFLTTDGSGVPSLTNAFTQGTFTPTITGSSSNPTPVYTIQVGRYQRVGRMVDLLSRVAYSSISGGSGNLQIDAPFTSANNTNATRGFSLSISNTQTTPFTALASMVVAYNAVNTAFFNMAGLVTAGTRTIWSVSTSAAFDVMITGTLEV